jgi:hypothetical protein
MMQASWIKEMSLAGALALATMGVSAPVLAQSGDDSVEANSIWNLEQRVWGGVVRGLGLKDPNAPVIDYRERSPLVVPPTRDLPPPQAKARPRDPAWPKDPDVAKARKAQETNRVRGNDLSRTLDRQGQPVNPDELNRGVAGRQQTASQSNQSNAPAPGSDVDGRQIPPSELGYFGGLFSGRAWGFSGYQDETGTFSGEPRREALTEPPPGYQTPSPEQPYGVTRRIERTKTEAFDPAGREYSR